MNATYVSPSPLTRGISVFVEADTGIYSFFLVVEGGGGRAGDCKTIFFFLEGEGAFCDRGTDYRYLT